MPGKLTPAELADAVSSLGDWEVSGDAITRTLSFPGHIEAVGFVVRVAMAAEVMDHHPDLRIVYNRVDLRLNSHDVGGVTDRDIRLATRINELL